MQKSNLKIAFLGTPEFVQCIRNELEKHFTLVDTLPQSDLAVIAAYGHILTQEELNTPKFGCINIHHSLLPKYRGPSPIQEALLQGDQQSGITFIQMDQDIDHGPIIYQETFDISEQDNFSILSNKMFQRSAEVLPQIITDFVSGKITSIPQEHTSATYCDKLTRESGFFDINIPPDPKTLEKMIRAYYPWPGAWSRWKGKIVKFLPNNLLQMEGKKPVTYRDFLNGYPELGAQLSSLFDFS